MATRGQVKWFDPKKGYGFIVGPQGQDVFVHFTQIQGDGFRSLRDGEGVDYELIQGEKGWQAQLVTRIDAPPVAAPSDPAADRPANQRAQTQTNPATMAESVPATTPSRGYSNRLSEA